MSSGSDLRKLESVGSASLRAGGGDSTESGLLPALCEGDFSRDCKLNAVTLPSQSP